MDGPQETRDPVRSLFPKWSLGKSYAGWYEEQWNWLTLRRPALGDRLRRRMPAMAGRRWAAPPA